jgi:hypothetical protein
MIDMQVIVRRQDQKLCASITCMIRHYVARRAKVIFDHPHNAAAGARGQAGSGSGPDRSLAASAGGLPGGHFRAGEADQG